MGKLLQLFLKYVGIPLLVEIVARLGSWVINKFFKKAEDGK